MEEGSSVEAGSGQGSEPSPTEKKGKGKFSDRAMKILRAASARESFYDFGDVRDKPSRIEVYAWHFYEFCSYFVQTVLIPVVFPLIISQIQHPTTSDLQEYWNKNHPGLYCSRKEITLYTKLTTRTIRVSGSNFSSLEWTAIAWAGGLALAAPILASISFALDGSSQTLVTVAATGVGVFFCLPAGFFRVTKIFIPYIAGIAAASTIATASHTHHLGLMVRGFTGRTLTKTQFHFRQRVSSWLSLHATAAGCVGSALISSFTYHMLRDKYNDEHEFVSLWIVSIFSGLIWLAGVVHAFTATNTNSDSVSFSSRLHAFSIFKYPHGIGAIFGVFLSSFTTMCIFIAGVIFIVGQLCIRPVHLLYFWLTYFLVPLVSLPLLNPFHHLIKASAVKMQILGFLLSILSSGIGFYYHNSRWKWIHLLIFGAIQGTSTGILHAFGRTLVMNCAPAGKEGAFSIWFAWTRSVGLCAGFAVGASVAGRIRTSFGTAFVVAIAGIIVLLFGNVSEFGGADAAGHVREESDRDPSGLRPKELAVHV